MSYPDGLRLSGMQQIRFCEFRSKVNYVLERDAYVVHCWPRYFGSKDFILEPNGDMKNFLAMRHCPSCHKRKIIYNGESGLSMCLSCHEIKSGLAFVMQTRHCNEAEALEYLSIRLKRFFDRALTNPIFS